MKGLLIKDYKLMLGQKSFLGMAALMAVLYLIIYKDPIVAVIFITVMCTMFTVSTLSYDEYENGMAYLFTLPISRNTYVLEKYAFALVNCIVTGVIMYAMACGSIKIRNITKRYVFRSGRCLLCINYYDKLYDSVVYKVRNRKEQNCVSKRNGSYIFNTVPGNKNIKRTEWVDTENRKSS